MLFGKGEYYFIITPAFAIVKPGVYSYAEYVAFASVDRYNEATQTKGGCLYAGTE